MQLEARLLEEPADVLLADAATAASGVSATS